MPQVKEPYGLVYNTDGSLCTTYRDDDIPFPGVRSFAVEEATENLITDLDPRNWNNDNTIVELTDDKYMGMPVYKVTMPETTNPRIFVNIPYTDGMTLTGSVYIKGIQYSSVMRPLLYFRETRFGDHYEEKKFPFSIGQWERINITHTFAGDGSVMFLLYTPAATNDIPNIFYMAMPQVEQKPFATSFVDGSRPTGIIAVPFHFDLNTEDWVVSFWHKMTNTYSFANKIIFSIDGVFHLNTFSPSEGKYNWVCRNTDNVVFEASSTTTVDTNWNFIVLVKNGLNFKVYINGILEINLNYIGTLKYNVNDFKFGNFKIGELGYVSHSLFSNIFIGKYRRPDGTVIWTDEYIREVYEAKIPYPAQNKLSIY